MCLAKSPKMPDVTPPAPPPPPPEESAAAKQEAPVNEVLASKSRAKLKNRLRIEREEPKSKFSIYSGRGY